MDACWVAGATLVILPAADPKVMLGAIAEHGVTMILVIPTLLRMLLDHPDAAGADLSSLRAVVYAAAPAAPALVRRSIERLGPVLYTGFGQTEAYGLNTFMNPAEHVAALEAGGERLTSVGHECAAFAQVRICDEDGSELPAGEVGEICVCAPWVTPGFWKRPELDRQRLQRGWLRTGDLGRVDSRGLRLPRRPQGGQDHHGWLQRLSRGDRGDAGRARCSRGVCGLRDSGSEVG